jgi:hypothetical protein
MTHALVSWQRRFAHANEERSLACEGYLRIHNGTAGLGNAVPSSTTRVEAGE